MTRGDPLHIRLSEPGDLEALDALFARSYPVSMKHHYPPSVLVTALPLISKAQPALLASGSYFVAERAGGLVAAGGWTMQAPGSGPGQRGTGHIRHVVTDRACQGQGIGRALMETVITHALGSGMARLHCQSTRNAVPFYAALGFVEKGDVAINLRPGIVFPAVFMERQLS